MMADSATGAKLAGSSFLKGQVALITGAGRGIGRAIAEQLAEEGCHLVLTARSAEQLILLAETIKQKHPELTVLVLPGDVQQSKHCLSLVEQTITHFGQLDILINNAGIAGKTGLLNEVPVSQIEAMVATNLIAPLVLSRYALEVMVPQSNGVIININSIAGKTAFPYWAVYVATKAGLKAATEAMAEEQRRNGIKILGVYPGAVATDIWDAAELASAPDKEGMLQAAQIAGAVVYALKQPPHVFVSDITLQPTNPAL